MNVTELRCTSCLAPIDPSLGPVQRCVYCGTTITIGSAPTAAVGTLRLDDGGPNKISVIKVIREHTGLGLKEAKDLVESAPCVVMASEDAHRLERFRADLVAQKARASINGKSAAAFRSAPATEPSRAGGAFLEDIGPNKIMVIKIVYDTLRLGLKDSKDLVERAPCVIGEHLDAVTSERLRQDLRAAGARVR